MAKIVIKTDHAVDLGLGNIQRFGNQWNGSLVDVSKLLLQCMQNRKEGSGELLQLPDAF